MNVTKTEVYPNNDNSDTHMDYIRPTHPFIALYLLYMSSKGFLPLASVFKLAVQNKKCVSVCVDCKVVPPLLFEKWTDNG